MTPRAPHLTRLPALDGLRGLGAVAVVVAHLALYWGLLPWPPLGGMGVLVFFVLSGYLIARLSLRLDGAWGGYAAFVRRRVIRLGPVVAAVAVIVPIGLWLDGMPWGDAAAQAVRTLSQTNGLATALGWQVHPTLSPSWSLTTEWAFYLLFPLAVVVGVRRGVTTRALLRSALVAAAVLYLLALPLPHAQFYYLPVANLGVMCVGAALAFAHGSGWRGPGIMSEGPAPFFALALVLVFVVLPGNDASWGYQLSVLPATTLAAAVMIHGVHCGHPVTRTLAWRPLAVIGVRAYSLYLWHVPVMWLVWRLLRGEGLGWMLAVGVPAIIGVTAASFALLERPVLPAGVASPRRPRRARRAAAVARSQGPELVES